MVLSKTAKLVTGGLLAYFGASGVLGALIFALIGGIFCIVFPLIFGLPFDDMRLDRGALVCEGELLERTPNPQLVINNRPTVRLDYRFYPGEGSREGDLLVTEDDPLAQLSPGAPLQVEFLPEDLSVSRIQGAKDCVAGWLSLMGFVFVAFGLVLLPVPAIAAGIGVFLLMRGLRSRQGQA